MEIVPGPTTSWVNLREVIRRTVLCSMQLGMGGGEGGGAVRYRDVHLLEHTRNHHTQHNAVAIGQLLNGGCAHAHAYMSTPGVDRGLSRKRRDVRTTRRCGHLQITCGAAVNRQHTTRFNGALKASRGFEPRSLDSESRVLTVTPRGQLAESGALDHSWPPSMLAPLGCNAEYTWPGSNWRPSAC